MGKIMRLGVISIILICVIAGMASAAVSMSGPATVTRGGVSDGEPNVDGYFNLSVLGNDTQSAPMHLGLIVNPQTMTGNICDRPPYLDNSSDPLHIWLGNGYDDIVWPFDVANPYRFSQVVPNGVDAPSVGCWVVPWESAGTHYYGLINTNNTTVRVGTLYPDVAGSNEFLATSTKPGAYTYHLQTDNLARSVPGVDSTEYSVTVTNGQVTASAYNLTQWNLGNLVPETSIQAGHTVMLSGINTDSQTTYLWLAGPDLPECGISLTTDGPLRVESNPSGTKGAYLNGTWFYQYTPHCINETGVYKVYASSVDPVDVVTRMCREDGGSCSTGVCGQGGICGLLACPTCGVSNSFDLTVIRPDFKFNLPEIVERCCCAVYPCGSADSLTNINLTGFTGSPGLPVQVWLFGNDYIGDKRYLIGTYTSALDEQGTFFLDLRNLLSDEEINFCDLEAGDYNLVVQIPGCGATSFDVGPEYIPGDLVGIKAFDMLIAKLKDTDHSLCLNCPPVTDRYQLISFTIRDVCNGGSVDFTATPREGYPPFNVQFTDASTFKGTSWLWTFGDNFTSTEQNPVHQYTAAGKYTVKLQVTSDNETQFTDKIDYITAVEVPPKYYLPIANFTYEATHDGTNTILFIDQSSASTPLTYAWDFAGIANSTNVSPLVQFPASGTYPVTLTVTDTVGKVSSYSEDVSVSAVPLYTPPKANFTFVPKAAEPMMIQFIDQSLGSTDLSYYWDFGDGSNSTEKVPAHFFVMPSTYSVSLTVTDTFGNVSTPAVQQVQVPATPSVVPAIDFTADITEGQYPLTVQFLDNTTTTWADSWQWNFGDGAVSSLRSPIHTYTTPGLYTVSLRAANVNGEGSEMIKPDYINVQNQAPVITATADPKSGNFPLRVQFNVEATVNNKTPEQSLELIKSYLWDFGDSSVSSEINPVHVYEYPGNYPVTVSCQLYDGVSSIEDLGTITVGPQPYANFYWDYLDKDETCCYLVKFTDTSVGATDVEWDFGDGLTSADRNPTHRFKEVGYYNVTQTAANLDKVETMTKVVQITAGYTTPTPTPTPTPVPGEVTAKFYTTAVGPRTIQFTDQSTGLIEGSSTWEWTFGDGKKSVEQNPKHTFGKDGEYLITLKVSNGLFSNGAVQTIGVR